jgi:hypothetical protein
MRSALVAAVLLAILLSGCSTTTTPSVAPNSPPKASPVGAPAGDSLTATIGAAGGTIESTDSRIRVTIPAGALAADTVIGIQPITDTDAAGFGQAYRLTPDGQTFGKPVTVAFQYTDTDLDSTFANALGIAFQDKEGRWESQGAVIRDAATKTLSVTSTHFTDFSELSGIQLLPGSKKIKPKRTLALKVVDCTESVGSTIYVLFACKDGYKSPGTSGLAIPGSWAVNGAPGGTDGLGLVAGDQYGATFTAPAAKPVTGSTVSVSVKVKPAKGPTAQIASNVTILSGYYLDGEYTEKNSDLICAGAISATVRDSVTADLQLDGGDDGYSVIEIANADTAATPPVVPVVGIVGQVTSPAEIFDAIAGIVTRKNAESNVLKVTLTGSTTIGECSYGGQIISGAETTGVKLHLAFDMSKVPASGSLKVKGSDHSAYAQNWVWTITEK